MSGGKTTSSRSIETAAAAASNTEMPMLIVFEMNLTQPYNKTHYRCLKTFTSEFEDGRG
jgi:hypothetical protein